MESAKSIDELQNFNFEIKKIFDDAPLTSCLDVYTVSPYVSQVEILLRRK